MTPLLPLYIFFGLLLTGASLVPCYLIWLAWDEKPTGRHLHH